MRRPRLYFLDPRWRSRQRWVLRADLNRPGGVILASGWLAITLLQQSLEAKGELDESESGFVD